MFQNKLETRIVSDGKIITVTVRRTLPGERARLRAYVDAPSPQDRGIMKQPPYSQVGDDSENDKLWKKYNKAELAIEAEAFTAEVQEFILKALRELGASWISNLIDFSKKQWNRKAGCSCGCSPGWLLRDSHGRRISFSKYEPHYSVAIELKDASLIEKLAEQLEYQVRLVTESINSRDDAIKAKEQELDKRRNKELVEFISKLNTSHEALLNREKKLAAELEQLKAL